jgi:hypothetical protein
LLARPPHVFARLLELLARLLLLLTGLKAVNALPRFVDFAEHSSLLFLQAL